MAYANFAAYTEWNNSLIYSTTAGYLATRIAGAAPMRKPAGPVAQLPFNELKQLQQLLVQAGFNVGKVDGVLGQQSRAAVKAMQIKYGLPGRIPGRPPSCWREAHARRHGAGAAGERDAHSRSRIFAPHKPLRRLYFSMRLPCEWLRFSPEISHHEASITCPSTTPSSPPICKC